MRADPTTCCISSCPEQSRRTPCAAGWSKQYVLFMFVAVEAKRRSDHWNRFPWFGMLAGNNLWQAMNNHSLRLILYRVPRGYVALFNLADLPATTHVRSSRPERERRTHQKDAPAFTATRESSGPDPIFSMTGMELATMLVLSHKLGRIDDGH